MSEHYDTFQAWARLDRALEESNIVAGEILSFHVALEREMDAFIALRLKRPQKLRGLGFGQKIGLLCSVWERSEDDRVEQLDRLLRLFNELRNSVAHGNVEKVKADFDRLVKEHSNISRLNTHRSPIDTIASDICAYLGGGFMTYEHEKWMESQWGLNEITGRVNVDVGPRMWGTPRARQY